MAGYQGNSGFKGGRMPTPAPRQQPMGSVGGLGAPPPPAPKMPSGGLGGGGWAPPGNQTPPWSRNPNPLAMGGGKKKPGRAQNPLAPGNKNMPYDWLNPAYQAPTAAPTATGIPDISAPYTPPVPTPQVPATPATPAAPATTAYSGPMGQTPVPGATPGVNVHHNMYEGNNRGQVRTNPTTGQQEILMGAGGGEQYAWQPYDANNYGHQQNSQMFNRYGAGWTSGSGATSMHGTDIAQVLRGQLGREPTMYEIYDIYYGKNRGQAGIAYNGASNYAPSGGG